MNKSDSPPRNPSSQWLWLLLMVSAVALLLGLLIPKPGRRPSPNPATNPMVAGNSASFEGDRSKSRLRPGAAAVLPLSPEEIVQGKVSQFAQNRLGIERGIARRLNQQVPPDVEKFFAAVQSGQWDEIKAKWDLLAKHSGQYSSSTNHLEELDPYWPAVLDAYGVAEQAHLWPAQKLLDYGNAVLDSLRPGMVYVGGTDNGRWIPELLNETSGGEPHIMVTQNALADARYLDFVNTLYDGQMKTLTSQDSQGAFQGYIADAQKRFEHDQQFPDEPKQVKPGEDIQMVDGKVQVSGAIAVMAINERLLQTLMQKNPDLSFAMEESFPFKGTYSTALPLGPLMELGGNADQTAFTSDRATQSLRYWQTTAQQLLADPEAADSPTTLKSYSHDAVAAANLLAANNYNDQAEQAYALASQLWPGNPESVGHLADMLVGTGRQTEARQILEEFARKYPTEQKNLERTSDYWRVIGTASPTK